MKRFLSAVVLGGFLWGSVAWAVTSKQYLTPGTPVVFTDTGTPSATLVNIDFSATGAGAGKYSAQADKGAGAQPANWTWTCQFSLTGTNVVGSFIEIYLAWWPDGTNADGGLGATKSTLATDKRRNLKRIGTVVVDQTTSNVVMSGSGQAFIPSRFWTLAIWNATGIPFQTSTTLHKCTFVPTPWEMQ